jgi:hypothetical protein
VKTAARVSLAVLLAIVTTTVTGAAESSPVPEALLDIYRSALSLTNDPPSALPRQIICAAEMKRGEHVTYLGIQPQLALLAARTDRPLKDPSADIWLTQRYVVPQGGLPSPRGADPRRATATMDWGYVFDRNGDGLVDHFALLESPMPLWMEDESVAKPRITGQITGRDFKMAFERTEMVFWHMSDLDFDGRHDAVIVPLLDEATGWIDSVLFSWDGDFDGTYEECTFFAKILLENPRPCAQRDGRFYVPGKQLKGLLEIPPDFDFIGHLNEARSKCGAGQFSFYRGPAEVPAAPPPE